MIYPVDFSKKGMYDVMPDEFKIRVADIIPYVVFASREEIIYTKDVFFLVEQFFTKVAS